MAVNVQAHHVRRISLRELFRKRRIIRYIGTECFKALQDFVTLLSVKAGENSLGPAFRYETEAVYRGSSGAGDHLISDVLNV